MVENNETGPRFTHDLLTIEVLCDFIQSLAGTIINIKRYPPGSAIIGMALDRCITSVQKLFEIAASFTLTENEKLLLVEDEQLPEKIQLRAYIRTYIDSLIARGIRSMTFHKGLTREEVHAFLNLIGEKPEDLKKRGRLEDLLVDAGVRHIKLDVKVFVALTRDQAIADQADLERLSQMGGDFVNVEHVKDGLILSFIVSKLPIQKLSVSDEQLEKLKKEIDYDRLRDARDIDFDKVGPLVVRALERLTGEDQLDLDAVAGSLEKVTSKELVADQRAVQIVKTFVEMSRAILNFTQPEIRAKLLNNFMKVVINFKELTLAKILVAKLGEAEGFDLKGQIISQISTQKKSHIIDFILKKYYRLIDGLNPDDFEIDLDELQESEALLKKILLFARAQERQEFSEKIQRAIGMARVLAKEGASEQGLLILKVKRLFAKNSDVLLQDDFIDNFGELAKRLLDLKRPDIIRKTIERLGSNFASGDAEVRLAAVNAFVRVHQDLSDLARTDLLSEGYAVLARQLKLETEANVFLRILASLVSDFGRLVQLRDLYTAANLLRTLERQSEETQNPSQKQMVAAALQRLVTDQKSLAHLVEILKSENEVESESAAKLLMMFDRKLALKAVFTVLKEGEEMRVRKKCIALIDRCGPDMLDAVVEQLSRDNPWYYNRNLLNILANIVTEPVLPKVVPYLADADERVRKAAISAVMKVGGLPAQDALLQSFDAQPESIRKLIVQFFGQTKAAGAVPKIVEALKGLSISEQTEPFVISLIQVLGQIGDPRALPAVGSFLKRGLLSVFSKYSDAIVLAAVTALGQLGGPDAAGILKKYSSHANPQIAQAARHSLRLLEAN